MDRNDTVSAEGKVSTSSRAFPIEDFVHKLTRIKDDCLKEQELMDKIVSSTKVIAKQKSVLEKEEEPLKAKLKSLEDKYKIEEMKIAYLRAEIDAAKNANDNP